MKRLVLWLTLGGLMIMPAVRSQEPAPVTAMGLDTLENLVDRWVALRSAIAEEKRGWNQRREQWEREIELLEREADWLASDLKEHLDLLTEIRAEQSELTARRQAMTADTAALTAALERAETDLRRWKTLIPDGLQAQATDAFQDLPVDPDRPAARSLVRRAQTGVTIYSLIETLHQDVRVVRAVLDVGDETRRRVDVLYLGLARAWAVSAQNDWAAIGIPAGDGWTWSPATAQAASIRRAIDVYHRAQPVQWVDLTVGIVQEQSP